MKFGLACLIVGCLALISLLVGVGDVSWAALTGAGAKAQEVQVLMISRIPRTLTLILAGMALAVAGLIMQMLTRNRFVEPSTAGTAESASLGILVVTLFMPGLPVMGKMAVAAGFALAGTLLFLQILRAAPLRSVLVVPLIGLMLGSVIESVTTFFAYRFDLLQALGSWTNGDFSGVMKGRYELIWIVFALTVAAFVTADRFTVAGMGESFTTNLGLNYRRVMTWGLIIVSLVTAVVVVTVGMIPFLGLIIPNLVSLRMGDNARKALPWVAVCGAGFVTICDIIGRLVRFPYEIPVGTVMGVIGAALFLYLLLRRRAHVA